jgi:LysR family glycine cleavage system transcriptional activator
MTQAAVSYQIKLLEERVGAPLFLRKPRQVALSEAGARLYPQVNRAFDALREAFAEVHGELDRILSITTVPTFASHWLAQNLGTFQVAHPGIAVRLDSSPRLVDFATENFDVAIRGTTADKLQGLQAHRVMPAYYTPMLSPRLAASIGGVREYADLLKLPLIDAGDPWFARWFAAVGVDYNVDTRPQSMLGMQNLEAAAAIAGQGVAMITPAFYKEDVAAGRLLQPFEELGYDGHEYWLVYPDARRNVPKIRIFRDWLLAATEELRE